MKKMTSPHVLKALALALLASFSSLFAQNPDPLVYTVGKTFETNGGTTLHNYILWQPGDAATTFGKRFAIYSKDGDANSPNPYSRLGIQSVQSSPSAIQALLKLGALFDADGAGLPERLVALQAEANATPLPAGYVYPTTINLDVAQALAQIMTVAETDAEVLQSLVSLGRAHPGVQMSLGLGFAIETTPASLITYEVREIDNADADLRVIGRVTLDAANPQPLVAPDPPRQVFHTNDPDLQLTASAKDHLTVLTRWGTPTTLREILPHTYGYNLYRVSKINLDNMALLPTDIMSEQDLFTAGGVRVNTLPAIATSLLTDAQAANPSFQEGDFFYGDDNDTPDPGFVDGEQFYYYVAARDIAGHAGPISLPSLLITVCDRLPPPAPSITSIENVFDMASADPLAGTGTQHLRVIIEQLPDTPVDQTATEYRIYRWHSATEWMRLGADPNKNHVGTVAHIPGQQYVQFDDDDATDTDTDGPGGQDPNNLLLGSDTGAPVVNSETDSAMGQTFWYTVRAVDTSACNPKNYSGHSGALYGVPRDRVGPEKPTGSLINCFCIPRISLTNEGSSVDRTPYGLDDNDPGFVVRVTRTDQETRNLIKKIKSFDVEYGVIDSQTSAGFIAQFSTTYYYQGFEEFGDVVVPIAEEDGRLIRVRSRLGDGSVSAWRTISAQGLSPKPGEIIRYDFRAYVDICCPILISSSFLRDENGKIDERILGLLPPPSQDPDCPSWIEVPPGRTPPGHSPVGPDDSITGVCGNIYLGSGVREVRVYRRVSGSSDFQLISRQASETDFGTVYTWKEAAPTLVNGVTACYYAQVFDEHGNGSALVRIGCVTVQNEDLGVPMLMDPVDLDPSGNLPAVQLSWFCDPVGVERFEVWAAAKEGSDPGIDSTQLSPPVAIDSNPTLTDENNNQLTFTVYRTNSLASGFGNNGEFSLNLTVPADKKIYYVIRAIGPQVPDIVSGDYEFTTGDFSNIVSDKWVQPDSGPQNVIPWPDRPLPGIADINVPVIKYIPGEGPYYAYPIPPSAMNDMGASSAILVGIFPAIFGKEQVYEANFPSDRNPIEWLFKYRKQNTEEVTSSDLEPINSFVVYRYQVPSPRFPNAQPNLVQVTPLIDRIAYETRSSSNQNGNNFNYFAAQDPFFIFASFDQSFPAPMPVPLAGNYSRDPATFTIGTAGPSSPPYLQIDGSNNPEGFELDSTMWVKDTIPASSGANYQYLLVHFTDRGEIERIIPTNVVSQP
ncbi:MAG: hypothetical protein AAGC74_01765 [Verrucomicrobiota bacterium]